MKKVALSEVKDDLSRYLHLAEREEIVITRHGRPAAVIIGFKDEDDWFDYRLENDPRFLEQIARAREEARAGLGIPLERVREQMGIPPRERKAAAPARKPVAKKRRTA
jgi:prevent-host-death family protein